MPSHDLPLRPLSSSPHETVIVADLRTERIVLWNPAAEALFGYSTAEALELPLERLVPDRLRAPYRDRLAAYRASGQDPLLDPSRLVELPALCKTGEEITLEVTLARLGPAVGEGDLVLAIARDRTARRPAGVDRGALLRVARLAGQVDADELLTNLLHEAVATVGGDSGGVYIWQAEQGGLVPVRTTLPSPLPVMRPGEGIAGRVWVEQAPIVVDDYPAQRQIIREVVEAGVRATVMVPLQHEGRPLGVLAVNSSDPAKRFFREDVDVLQIMASTAAATLVGLERSQQLRESEARFRLLAENARDVLFRYRLRPTRGFDYISPAAAELTGYSPEELQAAYAPGQAFRLVHPDDQPLLDRIARGEIPPGGLVTVRWIHKNGTVLWTEQHHAPVYDQQGQLVALEAVVRDITDRKRAEAEREQLIREQAARAEAERAQQNLAFLAEASMLLVSSLDYETTLQHVAQLAVPTLADWCAVDLLREDGTLHPVAVAHPDPAQVELAHALQAQYPPDLEEPYGVAKVLRTGQPELYRQVADESLAARARDAEHQRLLRAIASRSVMIVPMVARGRTLGAITLTSTQPERLYSAADLALAEDLARRAALAVDNARLYRKSLEAVQAREAALANLRQEEERLTLLVEASGALLSSLHLEAVLTAILDLSQRLVAADAYAVWRYQPATGRWDVVSSAGLSETYRRDAIQAMDHTTPLPDQLLAIEDIQQEPLLSRHHQAHRAEETRALLVLPLRIQGELSGTLAFYYHRPHHFSDADKRVAMALANLGAAALGTAELYEEQVRLRAEAQEAVALRDAFLTIAAHELKTPLTSLRGSAQVLLRRLARDASVEPQRLRHSLEIIDRQAEKLVRLIVQLLDVSRLEAGKLTLDRQPTDLVGLAEGVAQAMRALTTRHTLVVQAQSAVTAFVDPLRLEQVLTNLVDNAVKYSPVGGEVTLAISQPGADVVQIAVRDHGLGIPPEHRPKIFDRFYQGHTEHHLAGMGMGLYISRQIVELHGGSIEAEFPSGGGTCFVVTLPVSPTASS